MKVCIKFTDLFTLPQILRVPCVALKGHNAKDQLKECNGSLGQGKILSIQQTTEYYDQMKLHLEKFHLFLFWTEFYEIFYLVRI